MAPLKPGTRVANRYTIESVLGSGGFATVYLATDDEGLLRVALKVMSHEVCEDPSNRRRVEREAQILSSLSHRHIVRLLDRGETDDGRAYLVFERLPGEDLVTYLAREEKLDATTAEILLRQMLEALHAAHRAGIVHRDIKPENIRVFWPPNGGLESRLVDFGIARARDDGSPSLTRTGELVGTPRYMSPEQLTGRAIGPPSDIYSLGVTILTALLGQQALHGTQWHDQLERLRSGHVFAIGPLADEAPALLAVLTKMTATRIEDRYSSAQAVLAALAGNERPLPQEPAVARRAWVVPLALAVLAVLVLGALLFGTSRTAPPGKPKAEKRADLSFLDPTPPASNGQPEPEVAQRSAAPGPTDCNQPPLPRSDWPMPAYLPSDYDPTHRHPVVILFHDDLMEPAVWIPTSGFQRLADQHRFIIVAPNDANIVGGGAWRGDSTAIREKTSAVMRFVNTAFCVDNTRIFAVGQGHGGAAAYDLACEPWITAVATNSHLFDFTVGCETPKPFLLSFPDNTKQLPVRGGASCDGRPKPSKAELESRWRERNGCSNEREAFAVPGAQCAAFECGTPFTSCLFEGGRNWPNSPRSRIEQLAGLVSEARNLQECDGPMTTTYSPADTMWQFFASVEPLSADHAFELK